MSSAGEVTRPPRHYPLLSAAARAASTVAAGILHRQQHLPGRLAGQLEQREEAREGAPRSAVLLEELAVILEDPEDEDPRLAQ